MKEYILIKNDGIHFLSSGDVEELLDNPLDSYSVEEFLEDIPKEDREYWPEGAALLVHFEIRVPKQKTVAYRLEEL